MANYYRVFVHNTKISDLPKAIKIEDKDVYNELSAFVIAKINSEDIGDMRKVFLIDEVAAPSPPPEVPDIGNLRSIVPKPRKRGPYIRVVRYSTPLKRRWVKEIVKAKHECLSVIGSSTFVLKLKNKKELESIESRTYASVSDFVPTIHIDAEPDNLIISFFSKELRNKARRKLLNKPLSWQKERVQIYGDDALNIGFFDRRRSLEDIENIATLFGLSSISHLPKYEYFNDVARNVVSGGINDEAPYSAGVKLTGKGEIIAISDSGLDSGDAKDIHPDFGKRVVDIESFPIAPRYVEDVLFPERNDKAVDITGHGTHVCGSAVGNSKNIKGVAPEAKLVFQSVNQHAHLKPEIHNQNYKKHSFNNDYHIQCWMWGVPDDMSDLFKKAYDKKAFIYSMSWGYGTGNKYQDYDKKVDEFIWNHPEFLILVAAGNYGVENGLDKPNSIASPATAKNCVTVGACENYQPSINLTYSQAFPEYFPAGSPYENNVVADSVDDLYPASSRGPCISGRYKPDVVAPGSFVLSTRSRFDYPDSSNKYYDNYYVDLYKYKYSSGTSMATPLVAGCAVLLRQYLRTSKNINPPSASLLKAGLIHSAVKLNGRWTQNDQGWGRVDLKTIVEPKKPMKVCFYDEGLKNGLIENNFDLYNIKVLDTASEPLKITMVYTDRPGNDLIIDLNLQLYAPNNKSEIPDRIGSDYINNTNKPDKLNNIESIFVKKPLTGTWKLKVITIKAPDQYCNISECKLELISAQDDNMEKEIADFKSKFKSIDGRCAVLIIRSQNDPEKWTIAGYDNQDLFKRIDLKSGIHDDLLEELAKKQHNKQKIIRISASYLKRNYTRGVAKYSLIISGNVKITKAS